MRQYLDLLRHTLDAGVRKPTRAKVNGECIDAVSIFGVQTRYDLADGFPLVTTKKVPFGAIVHELLWMLRGEINVAYLRENNVSIWDEWADETGDLGPVYGKQWRFWDCPDGRWIDQIGNLVRGIEAVRGDPRASIGRRLIVSAWNPADVDDMVLPPCHTMFQVMLTEGKLSCHLYQRSADLFLGVPFNIASYALLTHLLAATTGVEPGEFIHTIGDAHIYTNHLDQVREQLTREPLPLPDLYLDPRLSHPQPWPLYRVGRSDITLARYRCHPALRGEVAV